MKSHKLKSSALVFMGVLGVILAVISSNRLADLPRQPVFEGISHVLPGEASLFMFAGDRYLAANFLMLKVLVSIGTDRVHYQDRTELQLQVARLNPYNADNYYHAAAALPWEGFVDESHLILDKANDARASDEMPAFFWAFGEYNFNKNYLRASELLQVSAARADEKFRASYEIIAGRWATQSHNYEEALGVVTGLLASTQSPLTKQRLGFQKERLENLMHLAAMIDIYSEQYGEPITVDDLYDQGLITSIPIDPYGDRYIIVGGKVLLERVDD